MVVPIPNPQRPVGTKQRFPGSPGLGELCFAQEIFLLDSGVHFIDASLRALRSSMIRLNTQETFRRFIRVRAYR